MTITLPSSVAACLATFLNKRLTPAAYDFLLDASSEIRNGAPIDRRAQLFSLASRHARASDALALDAAEQRLLATLGPTCNTAQWNQLETLRIALLLASPDIDTDAFAGVFDRGCRFADLGESCALYRSLPLLPDGVRFVARACEGCRTNMRPVFEAVACDSPYPARHFDDVSWRQLVIKAVFLDVPLWRVDGLDERLSPELARMALDLVDERRSAGRPVPPQLWLCLGAYPGERGLQALKEEVVTGGEPGQRGVLLALGRAGALDDDSAWLQRLLDAHAPFVRQARKARFTQRALQFIR
ncbi:EboA domain-containing protein [Trinickia dinghuensis]|uniref:HEAT repeat domain-containing protein n=1 Tax=Trinickia dinghuensis TaxID=2291023 RepID=A0A3D8JZF5_9BURK|nr:EboA domain-containing protein [Trinickia dinghuensis]RDU98004.1 hypothetical protein DWV00_15880 [Trinickia dinghuensis]